MGYFTGDCSLGSDLRFEVPSDIEMGDLIVKDGYIFNNTSGSITVYCDSFPDYSFRVAAMSGLEYRTSNYSYTSLPLTIDDGPFLVPALYQVLIFGIVLISALMIICRGGAKRA